MAPPSEEVWMQTLCPTCRAPRGGPAGIQSLSLAAPADEEAVGPRLPTGRLPTDRCLGPSPPLLREQVQTWGQPSC